MKKLLNFALAFSLILVSCKGKKNADGTIESSDEQSYAVCLWDRASLKEAPEEKGKWLESLSLGEKCEYLDDTKEDNSGAKSVKYYKVKLQGGKEGWVQASLISLNSKPAAFNQDAEIYSRPDLLTKTNKTYSKMDIVAVKSTQGDFIEVTGKRKDGKWIESGWVKSQNVTYSDIDIAVAKFGSKALRIEDKAKRTEAIKEIVENSDFSNSIFITELNNLITPETEAEEVAVDTLGDVEDEEVVIE
jgi:hypothetical protein